MGTQGEVFRQPVSEAEKREALKAGHYRFAVPPVCHARWDDDAWIRWIDAKGAWEIPTAPEREPDVVVEHHGSVVIVRHLTADARAWVSRHIEAGATTWGRNGIVVEPRYVADLVNGMIGDGLLVTEA